MVSPPCTRLLILSSYLSTFPFGSLFIFFSLKYIFLVFFHSHSKPHLRSFISPSYFCSSVSSCPAPPHLTPTPLHLAASSPSSSALPLSTPFTPRKYNLKLLSPSQLPFLACQHYPSLPLYLTWFSRFTLALPSNFITAVSSWVLLLFMPRQPPPLYLFS